MFSFNNISNQRFKNVIKNSFFGVLSSFFSIALNFLLRICLIRELGNEINGLNSLFNSIATTICIIEAGFSTAMIIHLYEPLKVKDFSIVKSLLFLYKRIYFKVAAGYLIISLIVAVFYLDDLVKSSLPMTKIYLSFAIFSLIAPAGYLSFTKVSILYADQKNRIYSFYTTLWQSIFRSLQILLILTVHSYYVVLVLMIFEKLFINVSCSFYVDKQYPQLRKCDSTYPDKVVIDNIYITLIPLFINLLSVNIQISSQSIVIGLVSSNISIVGFYGIYQLIVSVPKLIYSQIGAALTSCFGSLTGEAKEVFFDYYKKFTFYMNWLSILIVSVFIATVQNFIIIFFGEEVLLDNCSVILITIDLFLYLYNIPLICLQNAQGLHYLDKYQMLAQALIGVLFSYCLGKYFGLVGVLAGSLLPVLIFSVIYKQYIILNRFLDVEPYKVFKRFFMYGLTGGISIIGSYFFQANIIVEQDFIGLIMKALSAILLCFITFIVFEWRIIRAYSRN